MSRRRLVVLAIAFGCTSSRESPRESPREAPAVPTKLEAKTTPAREPTPPVPAPTTAVVDPPQPEPAPTTAATIDPPKPAAEFDEDDDGKRVRVHAGDRFEVTVEKQRNPPDDDFTWEEPEVKGDAIAFVESETLGPPPEVDGGSWRIVSRFDARKAGDATITMRRTPAQKGGPSAPYVLRVRVEK